MTNHVGERIRELRKSRNMTLDKLAKEAGASKSYIWELENRTTAKPSAEKLSNIAAALKTTLENLMGIEIEEDKLDPEDRIFFRKYTSLDQKSKEKFRRMVEVWEDAD